MRAEVLRHCHGECQVCKAGPGKPRVDAEIVHHVFHLEDYPEWGLCEFVEDPVTGERVRNLLPVCRKCHETVCHPERMRPQAPKAEPLTPERW